MFPSYVLIIPPLCLPDEMTLMKDPELVVFDLDFTLWDCDGTWCDCLDPPFKKRAGQISDRQGRIVKLYDDVLEIMDCCDQNEWSMAVASRTEQPTWAQELMRLLQISHRFAHSEIYPSTKLKHFAALRKTSGIEYERMIFFDDERRNINEVGSLGVSCTHIQSGLDRHGFQNALNHFRALA